MQLVRIPWNNRLKFYNSKRPPSATESDERKNDYLKNNTTYVQTPSKKNLSRAADSVKSPAHYSPQQPYPDRCSGTSDARLAPASGLVIRSKTNHRTTAANSKHPSSNGTDGLAAYTSGSEQAPTVSADMPVTLMDGHRVNKFTEVTGRGYDTQPRPLPQAPTVEVQVTRINAANWCLQRLIIVFIKYVFFLFRSVSLF